MALDPETRQFFESMSGELRAMREESEAAREYYREGTLVLRRLAERIDAQTGMLDAARGEIRAQTQAIWRVIDRMDRMHPGGAAA